jgi:protein-tyrosine phosphatase
MSLQTPVPDTHNYSDWHCHILPGLDDGAASLEESVEMAAALSKAGFSAVYCTPHLIRGAFEANSDVIVKSIAELQERLDTLRIDLRLLPGREHYLDEFFPDCLVEPQTLGADGHLLIEVAPHVSSDYLKETCSRISREGFTPLIAHPERSSQFEPPPSPISGLREWFNVHCLRLRDTQQPSNAEHRTPDLERPMNPLLDYLTEIGCQFQGNIGSFAGIYGDRVRRRAIAFLEAGIYSRLGTDAHSPRQLEQWVTQGLGEIERIAGVEALQRLLGNLPPSRGTS